MIFVVLAMGLFSNPFFSYSILPESASISTAEVAYRLPTSCPFSPAQTVSLCTTKHPVITAHTKIQLIIFFMLPSLHTKFLIHYMPVPGGI